MARLNVGDQAPDFELLNQNEESISLSNFKGEKIVVVFFYPKDETPGCVKEVCAFRDSYEDFTKIGAEVIGISSDSVASHKLFALNRRLPFHLLSDPKGKVRKQYDVSGSFMGFVSGRETFVIGKQGIVRHRFSSQFQIGKHIDEAMRSVTELVDAADQFSSSCE